MIITTTDNKIFNADESKCIGSVTKVRSRNVNKPARIGEYPVFVEQHGSYRIFTYNRKIKSINQD